MLKSNVFGCLPSSGLKMTVRTHPCIYILCNSRWKKFGNIRNNLFVQTSEQTSYFLCFQTFSNGNYIRYICMDACGRSRLGRNCWIINPSTVLRLWNVFNLWWKFLWLFLFFKIYFFYCKVLPNISVDQHLLVEI